VYYAFNTLAKLKAGEKVLIHAAAGGVGMAAIQMAKNIGVEIFVTVGSDAKRKLMQDMGIRDDHIMNSRNTDFAAEIMKVTNNLGVDVILNSLTGGDFIAKSLAALAPNGRFLEIGKRDIWSAAQIKELRDDVQYSIIAIDTLSQQEPGLISTLLAELMQEFAKGKLKPISVTKYPITDAKKAFRFMAQGKHTGKIVLTMQDELSQTKIRAITIKPDATYLVTGGMGGLGLEVAQWLVAKGAKNLALVGRSQPNAPTKEVIAKLEKSGVVVSVVQADIANSQDVANIFEQFKITGIIHAAGVLDDATIMQQNFEKYLKVITPKILGAWNLQKAIEKNQHSLDFFVSFSSTTSVLGNIGQSNYAAANAFLDTLSFYQKQLNINAISINWGPWSQVGLAANMDKASVEQMALVGIRPFIPTQGILALEKILLGDLGQSQVVVLDVNWQRYFSQFDSSKQPILTDIATRLSKVTKTYSSLENSEFIQKLVLAKSETRHEVLAKYLESEVRKIMEIDAKVIVDRNSGLSGMGMDSLMAVEFRNRITSSLGEAFSKALPATLMFNYPNINALSEYLLRDILNLETRVEEKNEKTPENDVESRAENLRSLSEDELDTFLKQMIETNDIKPTGGT
jgi:NADPH:quinone reductase-like Zn-dependent oxidoreductase/acyl carrier protein